MAARWRPSYGEGRASPCRTARPARVDGEGRGEDQQRRAAPLWDSRNSYALSLTTRLCEGGGRRWRRRTRKAKRESQKERERAQQEKRLIEELRERIKALERDLEAERRRAREADTRAAGAENQARRAQQALLEELSSSMELQEEDVKEAERLRGVLEERDAQVSEEASGEASEEASAEASAASLTA